MGRARLKVHKDRAHIIFDKLLLPLKLEQFPYNFAQVPHLDENFPSNMKFGGVEEAIFLFVVCFWMRGGIKSVTAFKALAKVHELRKELFSPKFIAKHPDPKRLAKEISDALKACGLAYRSNATSQTSAPREWIEDLTKLYKFWKTDPRNLLKDATSLEVVYDRMISLRTEAGKFDAKDPNGFLGFQEKMVSMIVFFWADRDLLRQVQFPIPVDFHVLRIVVACEIVTLPKNWVGHESDWKKLADVVRQLTQEYCSETGQDWCRLCDALWLLSGNVCNTHPGNTSEVGERAARATPVCPIEYTWNSRWSLIYLRNCARCPIESECRHAIRAAAYYILGNLTVELDARTKPPDGTFLPFN